MSEGAVPKTVAVVPMSALYWLYEDLLPEMRRHCGARFILLAAEDKIKWWAQPEDRLIDIAEISAPLESDSEQDIEAALVKARENERKYEFLLWRDMVQRERGLSTRMLGIAPNTIFADLPLPSEGQVARSVNHYLAYFEELFATERVDLLVSMGIGVMEGCALAVARRIGIPVTFPTSARKGGLMYWAVDPLVGDALHRRAYDQTPDQAPVAHEELVTPDGPRQRLLTMDRQFTLRATAHQVAIAFVDRAHAIWKDFRAGRRVERPNATSRIKRIMRFRRAYRRIVSQSISDLGVLSQRPFIFFPLAQEPEFTVQVRSREWNDQFGVAKMAALCLPPGSRLVIKEHSIVGRQAAESFETLLRLPNVLLAHPQIPGVELVKRAHGVMSLGGTASLEAAIVGKRSIILSEHSEYAFLPSIRRVAAPNQLPEAIRELLEDIPPDQRERFRRAAARFRASLDAFCFDASGTLWFGHGDSKLGQAELSRAVDLLCESFRFQKGAGGPAKSARDVYG